MQDRDLVYSCIIYEIARSGYAVSQCHLMSVLWVGCVCVWGGELSVSVGKSGNVGKS